MEILKSQEQGLCTSLLEQIVIGIYQMMNQPFLNNVGKDKRSSESSKVWNKSSKVLSNEFKQVYSLYTKQTLLKLARVSKRLQEAKTQWGPKRP